MVALVATARLFEGAIVSIARHPTATMTDKTIRVLVALVFPLLGPIIWFLGARGLMQRSAAMWRPSFELLVLAPVLLAHHPSTLRDVARVGL